MPNNSLFNFFYLNYYDYRIYLPKNLHGQVSLCPKDMPFSNRCKTNIVV